MARNYFLTRQDENSLGVKVNTNPFSMRSGTQNDFAFRTGLVRPYSSTLSGRKGVIPDEVGAVKGCRKKRMSFL